MTSDPGVDTPSPADSDVHPPTRPPHPIPVGERTTRGGRPRPSRIASAPLPDLLRLSISGDQSAFTEFYRLVFPPVSAVCRRVLVDEHEADDVSQDVLVEVWRKAGNYLPERGSVMNWVLHIAHHRAVDRVRSRESARRREKFFEIGSYQRAVDDTDTTVLAADERSMLSAALDQLSPRRREAVALAFFSDYTYQQASHVLGIPLGTYKSRVRDALIALHRTLSIDVPGSWSEEAA